GVGREAQRALFEVEHVRGAERAFVQVKDDQVVARGNGADRLAGRLVDLGQYWWGSEPPAQNERPRDSGGQNARDRQDVFHGHIRASIDFGGARIRAMSFGTRGQTLGALTLIVAAA